MNLKIPKIVSLDAMNTLIRLSEAPSVVYSRIAREEFNLTKLPEKAEMSANFREAFRQMEREMPCYSHGKPRGYRGWWAKVIQLSFGKNVQQQIPRRLSERLIDYYGTRQAWELTENELLGALRQFRVAENSKNIKLVIISNFDPRLRQILAQFDITSQEIDEYFLSGELALAKPDPRIFQMALAKFNLQDFPGSLLHIGDSVDRDFRPALQLGAQALLYRPNGMRRGDDGEEVDQSQCVQSISKLFMELANS